MLNVSMALCYLTLMFVSHACGQVGIVMARMETLVNDVRNNRVSSEQHMAVIIKHHIQALR